MNLWRRLFHGLLREQSNQPLGSSDQAAGRTALMERTLDHAKAGYQNAQDVIKFIDTKTAFVTSLSTVSAGFLVASLKWAVEGSTDPFRAPLQLLCEIYPCGTRWLIACVGLSFVFELVCLAAAVWSVIARSRPKNLEYPFTVLFPVYPRNQAKSACRFFEERLRGMTTADLLKEYEDQLRIVGMILGQKLKHIRIACIAFLLQMLALTAALVLMIVLYTSDGATRPDARSGLAESVGNLGRVHATFLLKNTEPWASGRSTSWARRLGL